MQVLQQVLGFATGHQVERYRSQTENWRTSVPSRMQKEPKGHILQPNTA